MLIKWGYSWKVCSFIDKTHYNTAIAKSFMIWIFQILYHENYERIKLIKL